MLHPDKSVAPGSEEAFKLLVKARTDLLNASRSWCPQSIICRLLLSRWMVQCGQWNTIVQHYFLFVLGVITQTIK